MRKLAAAFACFAGLTAGTGTSYGHQAGETTEKHMATGGPAIKGTYKSLVEGPGTPRAFPAPPVAPAKLIAGRSSRRRSIVYFAQLTDFQLADEESPVRVEFLDFDPSSKASSSWRPTEALQPWAIDYSFRQLNQFTAASPHRQGDGSRAAMDFGLITGDSSDNQQRNETEWVRRLIEGGQPLAPNSGKSTFENTTCTPADQAALAGKYPNLAAEAAAYTGVQDYSDYFVSGDFYDPDLPTGQFSSFPRYPGLMDRAQLGFVPVGLRRGRTPVPTYLTNGNHDGLAQGNEDAIKAFEDLAVGCVKPLTTTSSAPLPSSNALLSPGLSTFVPPDDQRHFVDRVQLKHIYRSGIQADGHGFDFIDPEENQASGFAATYYAADLKPGIRFISIDTVAEGGATAESDEGNIDDPQFRWLQRELEAARAADKLIVLFGHHPTRRLEATKVPDEAAQPCTGRYSRDEEGAYGGQKPRFNHDPNPGCDLDPRTSTPLHGTEDLQALLDANPNVIAYVAGHTHENELRGCGRPEGEGCEAGGNWWEINTSSGADWPQQHRLVEVMDNRDGTLSLLTTALEHASDLGIPAENASAAGFADESLASLARSFAFNDPQKDVDPEQVNEEGAIGDSADRNAELVVRDPRRSPCAPARPRIRGKSVGAARLGRKRVANRRAFPDRADFTVRRTVDRWCIAGGGLTRIGYPSRSYRREMSRRDARRTRGRAILVLTSHPDYVIRGVRPGTRSSTMRRRIRGERRYRVGKNTWYLARGKHARLVFKTRRGRVLEVGLADRRLTATRARTRRFLRAFSR